jgi:hypothetical protein
MIVDNNASGALVGINPDAIDIVEPGEDVVIHIAAAGRCNSGSYRDPSDAGRDPDSGRRRDCLGRPDRLASRRGIGEASRGSDTPTLAHQGVEAGSELRGQRERPECSVLSGFRRSREDE